MGYSLQDYEQLLERLADAQSRLNQWISRFTFVSSPVLPLLEEFAWQVESIALDAPAVLRFWQNADGWAQLRAGITTVAGDLGDGNRLRTVHQHWTGLAAESYYRVVPLHQAAAGEIGVVADKVQQGLTWTAQATAAFLVVVVLQVLIVNAALMAAYIQAATVVGLPMGLALLSGALTGALAALAQDTIAATAVYAWAKVFVYNVRSELSNRTVFPGGRWPASQSDGFRDGTVADGDADWSLRHA